MNIKESESSGLNQVLVDFEDQASIYETTDSLRVTEVQSWQPFVAPTVKSADSDFVPAVPAVRDVSVDFSAQDTEYMTQDVIEEIPVAEKLENPLLAELELLREENKQNIKQLEEQFDQERQNLIKSYEDRVAESYEKAKSEIQDELFLFFKTACDNLENEIANSVSDILEIFLSDELKKVAVTKFITELKSSLSLSLSQLTIEGSKELLDIFKSKSLASSFKFNLLETEKNELIFRHENGVLSTRLEDALKQLKRS